MDDPHRAAGVRDRRDADGVLDLCCRVKPGAVRPTRCEQPGREDRTGAGQARQHGGVGMLREQVGNRPVIGGDPVAHLEHQLGHHDRFQDSRLNDGGIGRERLGVGRFRFRPAGMERFPVCGDHRWVHRVQVEMGVFHEEIQETAGVLFQRHGHPASRILPVQISQPGMQGRGIVRDGVWGALLRDRITPTDIMMVIGPVNGDEEGIRRSVCHPPAVVGLSEPTWQEVPGAGRWMTGADGTDGRPGLATSECSRPGCRRGREDRGEGIWWCSSEIPPCKGVSGIAAGRGRERRIGVSLLSVNLTNCGRAPLAAEARRSASYV